MVILAEISRSRIYGSGMAKHALNMEYRETGEGHLGNSGLPEREFTVSGITDL